MKSWDTYLETSSPLDFGVCLLVHRKRSRAANNDCEGNKDTERQDRTGHRPQSIVKKENRNHVETEREGSEKYYFPRGEGAMESYRDHLMRK